MEKIMEIINEWDPIGFFPMAPKDEYINEIEKIYKYMCSNQDLQVDKLAKEINEMFILSFGSDIYIENMENYKSVAEKILSI